MEYTSKFCPIISISKIDLAQPKKWITSLVGEGISNDIASKVKFVHKCDQMNFSKLRLQQIW